MAAIIVSRGTRFHRLARESTIFEHWRLPVAAIIAGVAYGLVSVALVVTLLVASAVFLGSLVEAEAFWDELTVIDLTSPGVFAFLMLSVIAMAPCAWLPVRLLWKEHARYLLSVEGRLRWHWMLRCAVLSLVVIGAAIMAALALAPGEDSVKQVSFTGRSLLMVALVLTLTPLQSAAEEYVFRGLGLQLVGSWVRSPVLPVLATTVLFAAGHLYEFWGLVDVAVFGVAAAWLTIRTGGLEAAIAAHVVNNVLLFLLGIVGWVDVDAEGPIRPVDVLPTVVSMTVLVLAVTWQANRVGLVTRRPPQPPRPVAVPQPPMPVQGWVLPAPARPVAYVPPNAPPYPGQLTDGWR